MGLGGLCLGSLSGMYSVIKTGFFSNNSKYNFNDDLIAKIVIPSEMLSIDNTNQFKIIYLNIQKQLNNNILPKKIRDNIKKVLDKIVNESDKNNRLEKIVNMYFCLSINIGIYIFIKKYGKQKTDIMTDVFNNIFDTFFEEKHINKIKTNQICTIEKPYYSEKFNLIASYFALGIVVILLFLFFAKRYKM
jgi:hypothetical protein